MSGPGHDIYTHSDTFGIVVDHYGDARGTKNQFRNSNPGAIDPLINENIAAYHFATETLGTQLASIRSALSECWQGASAEQALGILTQLSTDATTIGTNTKACHDSFATFQASWNQLKGEAEQLYEGVAGTGVAEDNSGAHAVFSKFTTAMTTSMHAMPAHLHYQDPLDMQHASPGPGPGPGPGGPGPGPGGWGPGPGLYGPGGPGPGGWGPGFPPYGPGKSRGPGEPGGPGAPGGPGSIGTTGGPGSYTGGNGGYAPGAGLDTGSQLAGYTGGTMGPGGPGFGGPSFGGSGPGVAGPGPGFAGPGPGFAGPGSGFGGPGSSTAAGAAGLASSESALSAEAGISGVGSQQAAAGGRPMMGGRGGGGAGGNEEERDRTTWLSEEEGIWDGETGAPPGTIA